MSRHSHFMELDSLTKIKAILIELLHTQPNELSWAKQTVHQHLQLQKKEADDEILFTFLTQIHHLDILYLLRMVIFQISILSTHKFNNRTHYFFPFRSLFVSSDEKKSSHDRLIFSDTISMKTKQKR